VDCLLARHIAEHEQHFIKYVLAFFAASDGIVSENLSSRFMNGELLGTCHCIAYQMSTMVKIEQKLGCVNCW
jgi:ribonucleotide reductase beta subunit family protein with ferritin-like domain